MNDSLFDIPETKSPRLLWMEKHGIRTSPPMPSSQAPVNQWLATNGPEAAFAETEDEAITQLALKLGIKLHNEEGIG